MGNHEELWRKICESDAVGSMELWVHGFQSRQEVVKMSLVQREDEDE